MSENTPSINDLFGQRSGSQPENANPELTIPKLSLISKKLPIRYCEFKISNTPSRMMKSDTQAIAPEGVQFVSSVPFENGIIIRVWIEIPDYWSRKARHVDYKHTSAPSWFQMLARVLTCTELNKRGTKFQVICESVNLEQADANVLRDFLGLGAHSR